MKLIKLSLFFLVLGIIITSALACNSKGEDQLPLLTVKVQRGDLRTEVTASGNLSLSQTEDLAFDVEGTVEKVLVEAGDRVTEGQLLAQLETFGLQVNYRPTSQSGRRSSTARTVLPWENQKRDLESAVLKARAALNDALIALRETKSPQNTNAAPDPRAVQSKEYQVEIARTALNNAEIKLEQFLETSPEIRAPFDGFVTAVNVKGGDVVSKGVVAVQVAANDKFETKILVSELDISKIQIGMPATVQVLPADAIQFPATVTAISPTAASQGSSVNYEVVVGLQSLDQTDIKQQLDGEGTTVQLRDGFTVTVRILIQEKKDIITVPNRAIIRNNSGTSVQVIVDGKPENRVVTLGFTNGLSTEVIKGLSEGEEVVIQQTRTTTNSATPQISPRVDIHFH